MIEIKDIEGNIIIPLGKYITIQEAIEKEKSRLQKANFEGMNLRGANFEWADLRKANFERADLRGANFEGARQ